MIRRAPWWFPPISFVGLVAGVYLVSFFHPWSPTPLLPFGITGQLALLLMLVRVLWKWAPFAQWVKAMPWGHRIVFGALLGGMIAGHYTFNGRTYFPFVVWEIFPHAMNNTEFVPADQIEGKTVSGKYVRLLVEREFPSIIQVDRIETLNDVTTEHLARALAKMYNADHPGDPVRAVGVFAALVYLHPPANKLIQPSSWQLQKSYKILPAPSH